jgi:hypothetical protein
VRIAKPELSVRGSTRSLGRVPYGTQLDIGSELVCACHGRVEVLHLEPQQHAVAQGPDIGLAQRTVVVLDFPTVQLEHESSVVIDQAFVVRSAVVAPSSEQVLEPLARGLDVVDCEEWLCTHSFEGSNRPTLDVRIREARILASTRSYIAISFGRRRHDRPRERIPSKLYEAGTA